MWPYSIVQLDLSLRRCTVRAISSPRSSEALWSQILARTRSAEISAPPLGHESRPAVMKRPTTSPTGSLEHCERKSSYTILSALMWIHEERSFKA